MTSKKIFKIIKKYYKWLKVTNLFLIIILNFLPTDKQELLSSMYK